MKPSRISELTLLLRGSPFVVCAIVFALYDAALGSQRIWEHPQEIDLLVSSTGVVLAAFAASSGFHLAQSPKSLGIDPILQTSQQGPLPLLIRVGRLDLTYLLSVPIVLHVIYLLITGAAFTGWQWAPYVLYAPSQILLGFVVGLACGRFIARLRSPQSIGIATAASAAFGVAAFFATVSLPPTKDPASPLNVGLVSVVLPPVFRYEPFVIVRQIVLAVAITLVLVALLALSVGRRRLAWAGVGSAVVGLALGFFAFSFPGAGLVQRIPASYCVGTAPTVCTVPLEARGARLLATDLNAVGTELPRVVPQRVVQDAEERIEPGTVSVLRVPGDAQVAPRYAVEVLLKKAQCSLDSVSASPSLQRTLTELEIWLASDTRPLPSDLRESLASLAVRCG